MEEPGNAWTFFLNLIIDKRFFFVSIGISECSEACQNSAGKDLGRNMLSLPLHGFDRRTKVLGV